MRLVTLLCPSIAVGLLACTAEQTPTEPSTKANAASATAATYRIVDLGTLGGAVSEAFGINNGGQVVGYSETAGGENHAFIWQNGAMTDLGTLGGVFSFAHGINAIGQVVRESATTSGEVHVFLWQNGVMRDLGTLGGSYSEAWSINSGARWWGEARPPSRGGVPSSGKTA